MEEVRSFMRYSLGNFPKGVDMKAKFSNYNLVILLGRVLEIKIIFRTQSRKEFNSATTEDNKYVDFYAQHAHNRNHTMGSRVQTVFN